MKKKVMLLTLIVSTFLLISVGFTFQNEPDGFRELKWGDPPTEDMIYRVTALGERGYTRPDDKMYVGNAQFYLIVYAFHGEPEKFMAAILYFKGEKNFNLLETICRGKFGEETEKGFYDFIWMGQKSTIFLRYDVVKKQGDLSLISIQILAEKVKIDKQKEIEKSKEDW